MKDEVKDHQRNSRDHSPMEKMCPLDLTGTTSHKAACFLISANDVRHYCKATIN